MKKIRTQTINRQTFYLICGLIMAASEIWKQWTLTFILNDGYYNWWYFPFQLCSIPMYLCLLIPWIHSEKIRSIMLTFLMDFGLLGGIFTFFDTSGMHYGYLPLTIHSYLWHILLIIIGIYTGYKKDVPIYMPDYSWKGYIGNAAIYLTCCGIATIFNLVFYRYGKINMFYISPHYWMEQKVFRIMAHQISNPAAILLYIAASILGAGVIHLIWHTISRKRHTL